MIMRGLAQSLKEQNWTAILIEFVLLVVGVFLGIQVANWNEARIEQARTKQALDAFRVDMRDQMRVAGKFGDKAATCLAAFEAARQSGLADLVQPGLMFEIGFYYSEIDGVGAKFVRYSEFVNERILPHLDDPTAFYDERGELKPEYRQNMQRLREWVEDNDVLAVSAECLLKRFDAPKAPGQSCRPDYEHLDGKAATP